MNYSVTQDLMEHPTLQRLIRQELMIGQEEQRIMILLQK